MTGRASHIDYAAQAAACGRAAVTAADPETRRLWLEERQLWLALAAQSEAAEALARMFADDLRGQTADPRGRRRGRRRDWS